MGCLALRLAWQTDYYRTPDDAPGKKRNYWTGVVQEGDISLNSEGESLRKQRLPGSPVGQTKVPLHRACLRGACHRARSEVLPRPAGL